MAWFVFCVGLIPAPAGADALQKIQDDIATMNIRLKNLLDNYGDVEVSERRRKFNDLFKNAEILYLLGDFDRASLLLFDLVEDPKNRAQRDYQKALYYLAESQFQMGNVRTAQIKFNELMTNPQGENFMDALRRLISLADKTGNWSMLEGYLSTLRRAGRVPPSVAYMLAKSFLVQKRYADVAGVVSKIPSTNPLYPKARYVLAVAYLYENKNTEARRIFSELALSELAPTSAKVSDAYKVKELAMMSEARLLMEEGSVLEAVDAYQRLPRESALFEDSLFEVTWLYLRAAEEQKDPDIQERQYNEALKSLEILLLGEPQSMTGPEARILMGNILLRLDRHDEAIQVFSEVVQRYEPVRRDLEALVEEALDPEKYYETIISRVRTDGVGLPPVALKWANAQGRLQKALNVVGELDDSQTWLQESQEVADTLFSMLDSEKRLQFFPALRDAKAEVLELENALVDLSFRLLAVEREIVRSYLSDNEQEALEKVLSRREELEPAYMKLPKHRDEYEGRVKTVQQRLEKLERKSYRLGWDIEQMRRGVEGVSDWLASNPDQVNAEGLENVRSRLEQAQREIDELERVRGLLQAEIKKERSLVALTLDEDGGEAQLRLDYAKTLASEKEILSAATSRVEGDDQVELARMTKQRNTLLSYHAELGAFQENLQSTVSKNVTGLKSKLEREFILLKEHVDNIAALRAEAQKVVGGVALDSLRDAEKAFKNIVIRGDVGIVDVAWALKESNTDGINRKVSSQRAELKFLDDQYRGVMGVGN
jgi:TolA-binding protein